MHIEPYLLSSALNGAVAQRLARSICQGCATKYYPTERELRDAGLADKANKAFRKGAGCQQCHDSGFQGRFGIYEVMEVGPDLRRMIHQAAPSHELRQEFRRQGGRTLREEGVNKALEGMSSLEEILRVTHSEDSEPLGYVRAAAPAAPGTAPASAPTPVARPAPAPHDGPNREVA
jgi:type II secretory ATPase GspE/PulE/Tfp pilus assembly ATPase PilB-like protein